MSKARILLSLAAAVLFVSAGARAANSDTAWRTPLHVSTPLEIPGMTLQPGDYMVKVLDTTLPRKTVQFTTNDESKVVATVMAVPMIRTDTSLSTHFVTFQRSEAGPDALKAWFYLDNNYGIEFIYPKEKQETLAKLPTKNIIVAPAPETQVAQNTPAPAPAVTAPEPTPAPAAPVETPEPKALPKTGSDLPLVALGGVLMLAGAGALHLMRKGL